MIFLDTCIWFELLVTRIPETVHEKTQVKAATELLGDISKKDIKIISCEEQMLELINAIEKAGLRYSNRERKQQKLPGFGKLKEFRSDKMFEKTKEMCESAINDLRHFAEINNIGEYDMDQILNRIDLADINDCLYYDYCIREKIAFYSFDGDLRKMGNSKYIYTLKDDGAWRNE
ncbi:MAG: PIN domain-containing protein [Muricoprocola sp.]